MENKPILIIGAGIVGLSLANGLKKAGIPFQVFERDEDVFARDQGWAITVHWALPFLKEILSPRAFARIDEAQVDPEVGRNDTGNFLFLNLATLQAKFRILPAQRRRVSRDRFRRILLDEVRDHVHWRKRLIRIEEAEERVVVHFEDGTNSEGALVVGAEGSNSRTRQHLAPDTYENIQLPVRLVGAAVDLSPGEVKPLRAIDPLLFQGCHPTSGNYLWVSMLQTPGSNGTAGTSHERYRVQIVMSWPMRTAEDEVKATNAERLVEMKRRADDFHSVLRDVVHGIPDTTEALEIVLQDWPCLGWDSRRGGRVTLAGDAAHAMTMYRGEAANHGILDALKLFQGLQSVYRGRKQLEELVGEYETELRTRATAAVLLSRQACLDAHDWASLNEGSAILKRRAIDQS